MRHGLDSEAAVVLQMGCTRTADGAMLRTLGPSVVASIYKLNGPAGFTFLAFTALLPGLLGLYSHFR